MKTEAHKIWMYVRLGCIPLHRDESKEERNQLKPKREVITTTKMKDKTFWPNQRTE